MTDAIVRSVQVPLDPAAAFDLFTSEVDAWWERGPHSFNDPSRAVGIRFEPGEGGRWIEVWDAATGEGYDMGRILTWEPGRRFVVAYRSVHLPPEPLTELEVRFERLEDGTRVTLEHRGFDSLPPDIAQVWRGRAWKQLVSWYARAAERRVPAKEQTMTIETQATKPSLSPCLACKDSASAIDFYKRVFGAVETSRWTDPTGKVGHAELLIGGSQLMLADESPELGFLSPVSLNGTPVQLHLYVPDVDAVAREAQAAGAALLRPVADQPYGDRSCQLRDPFGHVWGVATHLEDVSREEVQKRVGDAYQIA